jgi:predicted ATP-grasp superfamily ATP-dependent carboligase
MSVATKRSRTVPVIVVLNNDKLQDQANAYYSAVTALNDVPPSTSVVNAIPVSALNNQSSATNFTAFEVQPEHESSKGERYKLK